MMLSDYDIRSLLIPFFSNVGINLAKGINSSKYPPGHYIHGNYTIVYS